MTTPTTTLDHAPWPAQTHRADWVVGAVDTCKEPTCRGLVQYRPGDPAGWQHVHRGGHPVPDGPARVLPHVDLAERALRHFGESELTREHAARLLGMWAGRWMLNDDQVAQVLARFPVWSP